MMSPVRESAIWQGLRALLLLWVCAGLLSASQVEPLVLRVHSTHVRGHAGWLSALQARGALERYRTSE